MLFDVETPDQRAGAFRDFARLDRVDGLLVISLPLYDDEVMALERDHLPVVMVDIGHPRVPHVVTDDVRGGELAAEHLISRGHRRIGFVGDLAAEPVRLHVERAPPRGLPARAAPRGDRAGWRDRTARQPRPRGGAGAAEGLLRRGDRPTAVFAASDTQALGVLEAAQSVGLRVPEDLAVIGFDDTDIAAALGLSTVRQPLRQSGARGADCCSRRSPARSRGPRISTPLEVVGRRTT